jgi:SAM-dependent methyltransferase
LYFFLLTQLPTLQPQEDTTSSQPTLDMYRLEKRGAAWAQEAVVSPDATRQAQMGKIFGYTKGLHATHLIDIGSKLGLFERLAAAPGGLTPDGLADAADLYPPYARFWCEAACALELLDYDPSVGYRLAPCMDEILGQPAGTYYLGLFPDAHLQVARDYARYPDFFRTGEVHPYQQHDHPFFESIAGATRTLPRMFLDAVLPKLPTLSDRLTAGATILDVGCGAGYALVEFAERYPQVRCVGIDVEPASVQMAQELIRERGLVDRVEARLVEDAVWPDGLTGAFDLVMSFLVLHEIHPDLKDVILGQCVRALRPKGQLLIFDERYPSTPGELRDSAQVFAVMAQWYELLWGNIVNTREEIHAMLAQQGLRVVDETALSRFYIVTAELGE